MNERPFISDDDLTTAAPISIPDDDDSEIVDFTTSRVDARRINQQPAGKTSTGYDPNRLLYYLILEALFKLYIVFILINTLGVN